MHEITLSSHCGELSRFFLTAYLLLDLLLTVVVGSCQRPVLFLSFELPNYLVFAAIVILNAGHASVSDWECQLLRDRSSSA